MNFCGFSQGKITEFKFIALIQLELTVNGIKDICAVPCLYTKSKIPLPPTHIRSSAMEAATATATDVVGTEETWKCVDDGTGRGKFYISSLGNKSRVPPANFEPELLCNGERFYYFLGACVRCRSCYAPFPLQRAGAKEIFSFNVCESCCQTLAQISLNSSSRGHGDRVWAAADGMPKHCIYQIEKCALDLEREKIISSRSLDAKYYVLRGAKHRFHYFTCSIKSFLILK